MSAEEIFAQRMRLGRLFDIYGGLLTAKQKQCLGLYFYDDLSLVRFRRSWAFRVRLSTTCSSVLSSC